MWEVGRVVGIASSESISWSASNVLGLSGAIKNSAIQIKHHDSTALLYQTMSNATECQAGRTDSVDQ